MLKQVRTRFGRENFYRMISLPDQYVVEFEVTSVLGSLYEVHFKNSRDRKADLQIVVMKRKATVRDIAAAILALLGIAETGPSLSDTSSLLAAVLFAASGVVDIKVLKGWPVDELINMMSYDSTTRQFYLAKADLTNFLERGTIDGRFVDWLIEAGALVDEKDKFRVNKLFKKGNIVNII